LKSLKIAYSTHAPRTTADMHGMPHHVTHRGGRSNRSGAVDCYKYWPGAWVLAQRETHDRDELSFRLLLPGGEKDISSRPRVLWTREYGAVGCEFLPSAGDIDILPQTAEA